MNQTGTRLHFMDSGRALFMLLGIPYHAAMICLVNAGKGPYAPLSLEIITMLAAVINAFRMPAFFIIAGFFSALILMRKTPSDWFKSRLFRLGVPFVCATILINPFQMYLSLISGHYPGLSGNWGDWWQLMTTSGQHWVRHLWFLPSLIIMSALIALIWKPVFVQQAVRVKAVLNLCHRWYAVAALTGIAVVWAIAVKAVPTIVGHDLTFFTTIINLPMTATYLPYFLLGVALCFQRSLFESFLNFSWASLIIAGISLVVFVMFWGGTDELTMFQKLTKTLSGALTGLYVSQCLFVLLSRFMNGHNRLTEWMVYFSFSIYLFHQPVLEAMGYGFIYLDWNPLVEFVIMNVAGLAVSLGIAWVIHKSVVLSLMFNGARPKRI
ncbi:MAG: acyltransferase family protein [Asticcacaulis sp.]